MAHEKNSSVGDAIRGITNPSTMQPHPPKKKPAPKKAAAKKSAAQKPAAPKKPTGRVGYAPADNAWRPPGSSKPGTVNKARMDEIIIALTGSGIVDIASISTEEMGQIGVSLGGAPRPGRLNPGQIGRLGESEAVKRGLRGGGKNTITLRTALMFMDNLAQSDNERFVAMQQKLWKAGYYDPEMYKNKELPRWGTAQDDGYTRKAFQRAISDSLMSGRDIESILAERSDTYADDVAAAEGLGPDGEPLDEVITTTNPDTIRSQADQLAQRIYGRDASEEEKNFAINLINSSEINVGMLKVGVNRNNRSKEMAANGLSAGGGGAGARLPGGSGLLNPVPNGKMSENFGQDRGTHAHGGVDISAPGGTPIQAAKGGVVIQAAGKGDGNAAGNRVWIRGDDGRFYGYFHMSDKEFGKVSVGTKVAAGQVIGLVGNTGRSKGNHLHFEINTEGVGKGKIDPAAELKKSTAGGPASMSGAADIDKFMAAMRQVESGNRYDWNVKSGVGASGAYQFMPGTWKGAAKMAGINPNDHSPANQDAAARALMSSYYNKYKDWRLVAIAWHGGGGAADKEVRRPGYAATIGDGNMKTDKYAAKVLSLMGTVSATAGGGMDAASPDGTTHIVSDIDGAAMMEQEFKRRNPEEVFDHSAVQQYNTFKEFWGREGGGGQ